MRKRNRLFVLVSILAVVGSLLVMAHWPSRFRRENYHRIQPGMTRPEIEAIFGCPPGDYRSGPTDLQLGPSDFYRGAPLRASVEKWEADDATIVVSFDASGRAVSKSYWQVIGSQGGMLDNLLWQFKRQWRRWFP